MNSSAHTYGPDYRAAAAGSVPDASGAVEVIGEFGDYAGAQHLVDRLSDDGFPVESVRIVGSGLRTVEDVTGRMTKGRASLLGAATGAWFGLLIGLLVGLFTIGPAWFGLLITALLLGAVWGALIGFVGHWATRGRRDFSSTKHLVADRYQVQVEASLAARARGLLGAR